MSAANCTAPAMRSHAMDPAAQRRQRTALHLKPYLL
jgi:hypothetical protein